jgi:hypothetical protein
MLAAVALDPELEEDGLVLKAVLELASEFALRCRCRVVGIMTNKEDAFIALEACDSAEKRINSP